MTIDEKKKEYNRKYYESHRTKLIKDASKYSKAHREEINARNRKWSEEHPEEARAKGYERYLQHKASNPRWHKRRSKRHSREWRADHPDYQKKWRKEKGDEHRKYMSDYMREWRKRHPRLTKKNQRNTYERHYDTFIKGRLRRAQREKSSAGSHTYQEWMNLLIEHDFCCLYCKKKLTRKTATRDHMQPISRNGSDFITNIAPACLKCNISKRDKTSEEYFIYLSNRTSTQ